MAVVEENDMQLVEREGTYELVDTKSLSAARLLEDEAGRESVQMADGPEPEPNAPAQAATEEVTVAPVVIEAPLAPATLPITPSDTTKEVLYTPYERATPVPLPQPRSKSAGNKKSNAKREQEEIEKKQMAEAAFSHWKREKDNETLKKRQESKAVKVEVDRAWEDPYKVTDRDSPAFKSWLQEKGKQRAAEREIEKLRAQLITAELLTVDYQQTEGAYERWLKEKNKKTRNDKQERDRRSSRDRAQLKQVMTSLKTRWIADYNRSNYLHPNTISSYDNTIACMDDY